MNKKALIGIIAIIAVIVAAIIYVLIVSNNTEQTVDTVSTTDSQAPAPSSTISPESTSESTSQTGSYRDYSADAVASTEGTKLLFFHAPWCPQCREMDQSIKDEGLPDNVTVFKVDYDSNQQLRQKYGVTIQTTFVKIDDSGNKVDQYVAYDEPQFSSVERNLLK
jgi:thiol-disulfide isomerase/thioredoxin